MPVKCHVRVCYTMPIAGKDSKKLSSAATEVLRLDGEINSSAVSLQALTLPHGIWQSQWEESQLHSGMVVPTVYEPADTAELYCPTLPVPHELHPFAGVSVDLMFVVPLYGTLKRGVN